MNCDHSWDGRLITGPLMSTPGASQVREPCSTPTCSKCGLSKSAYEWFKTMPKMGVSDDRINR
jgi:hypothetical protein